MRRDIWAVLAGAVFWIGIVMCLRLLVRLIWPEYAAAEGVFAFTLPMRLSRLTVGAVAMVIASLVTGMLSQRPDVTTIVLGSIVFLGAVPDHIVVWNKYPVWYHFTFFASLLPLSFLGGKVG